MIKSPWKNVADLAGVKPQTSWSPVGRASNWATEAGNWHKLKKTIFNPCPAERQYTLLLQTV